MKSRGLALSIVTASLLALAQPATAQFPPADASCRKSLAKGMRLLSNFAIKERAKCFAGLMRGTLSGVNCNDLADPAFPGALKVQKGRDKLHSGAQSGCATAATPQELGYLFCPPPCSATSVKDYIGVADCLQCRTETETGNALDTTYGTPPAAPPPEQQKCQNLIGTALRRYFLVRMKEQQKCQTGEDLNPTGANCRVADPRLKVEKTRTKLKLLISKCDPAGLPPLDTCADDIPATQACVEGVANTGTDRLFDDVYDPAGFNGIFVSVTLGTPTGAGTITDPLDTVEGGINKAMVDGEPNVFIDGGVYPEVGSVDLVSGISLVGGFNSADGWLRDGSTTAVFAGSTTAVLGSFVSDVAIDGLDIHAAAAVSVGASSFGVRLISPTNVSLSACEVFAGDGGGSSNGSGGGNGSGGNSGGNGGNGCEDSSVFCSSCSTPARGSAGPSVSCFGSTGGQGGLGGSPGHGDGGGGGGSSGLSGTGAAGSVSGGGGGPGGGQGSNGTAGSGGNPGNTGSDGAGGASFGSGTTLYTPANGGNGGNGSGGSGGGAGGGGGGGNDVCDSFGGGGGGGGSGGCGGQAGTAGTGAGGSFGVWISGGTGIQIANTVIHTGAGGTGGAGGIGGSGGPGGPPGTGGTGEDDSGAGNTGGGGGNGGRGGHGGGGGGGPSVGIVCRSGAAPGQTSVTFMLGSGGAGGFGAANPGANGTNQNTFGCP